MTRHLSYQKGLWVQSPSGHDLYPQIVEHASEQFVELLNKTPCNLLIHSKPSLSVMQCLAHNLYPWRDRIMFSFTIGTANAEVMKIVETMAPELDERVAALEHVYKAGFQVGVGCTPALDIFVEDTYQLVRPWLRGPFRVGAVYGAENELTRNYKTRGKPHNKYKFSRQLLHPQTEEWVESYREAFNPSWARGVLDFASRTPEVICEGMIHALARRRK
jgi:DNA repair photolyase